MYVDSPRKIAKARHSRTSMVSKRDLEKRGIQESWEKEGGGGKMHNWRVRVDRGKEERAG